MIKTIYHISQMDCPSEENLIRMKLMDYDAVKHLVFDIPNRKLTVYHEAGLSDIDNALSGLQLGAMRQSSEMTDEKIELDDDHNQRRLLWSVLLINLSFFVIEMLVGLVAQSMGLIADSLDMLADAFVYALSLMAVGGTMILKKRIATLAGYFQILLATVGFIEVIRRFVSEQANPNFQLMIVVSIFALVANGICLFLLQSSKSKEEAHMKASMIFTSNDIIINMGVVLAGVLVYYFQSNIPDLVIGAIVFGLVMKGARSILQLGK